MNNKRNKIGYVCLIVTLISLCFGFWLIMFADIGSTAFIPLICFIGVLCLFIYDWKKTIS